MGKKAVFADIIVLLAVVAYFNFGKVTDSKLYTLADSGDNYDWHVLEIIIINARVSGVYVYF